MDGRNPAFPRMISDFVRLRGADCFAPREVEQLRLYLVDLAVRGIEPPAIGRGVDWRTIAAICEIDAASLLKAKTILLPGLEALRRDVRKAPPPNPRAKSQRADRAVKSAVTDPSPEPRRWPAREIAQSGPEKPMVAPLPTRPSEEGRHSFREAFTEQMTLHAETAYRLSRALSANGVHVDAATLRMWRRGIKAPARSRSLRVLDALEAHWGLPPGYFRSRLPHPSRAVHHQAIDGIGAAERRRLAWHLPDDFERRSPAEREEILEWVRRVIVTGATDYRRYQAAAMKHRFAVRFPEHQKVRLQTADDLRADGRSKGTIIASSLLAGEMRNLITFKTATLTKIGYQRRGVWGEETASQKVEHFGLLFGALAAAPDGPVRGHGVPMSHLTFGLLVIPEVWDWYTRWRERRRGFLTAWESDMLSIAVALTAPETGWLTQTPSLGSALQPIEGLVTAYDISRIRADWPGACAVLHRFAMARAKEIGRVSRVHHDPFEPILPVLESSSPVGEYRKIADEILALRPCPRRYPKAAAENVRAFLMIRFGLHLGFRQKNLRQLLICPRGNIPRSERQLADRGCGELRWSERESGWEVFVPANAFKNATSSFFSGRPFRLILPDIGALYDEIEAYVGTYRALLLGAASDPGTFFVKTAKSTSDHAAYDQTTFYEAWRWIIQRYGIHNPYTGRGAIVGLLPHGPHSVRDVLATHVLKQTGSYEQASYAIQDTPDTVANHYGRFLPQDKAGIAAQILNRAWEDA